MIILQLLSRKGVEDYMTIYIYYVNKGIFLTAKGVKNDIQ